MRKFKCQKCGSERLAYQSYVNCITPVSINEDQTLHYSPFIINEDDYTKAIGRFCCADCKTEICYRRYEIETEKALLGYLSLSEEHIKQQEEFEKLLDRLSIYD
jgi:hypothetical protein